MKKFYRALTVMTRSVYCHGRGKDLRPRKGRLLGSPRELRVIGLAAEAWHRDDAEAVGTPALQLGVAFRWVTEASAMCRGEVKWPPRWWRTRGPG